MGSSCSPSWPAPLWAPASTWWRQRAGPMGITGTTRPLTTPQKSWRADKMARTTSLEDYVAFNKFNSVLKLNSGADYPGKGEQGPNPPRNLYPLYPPIKILAEG